MVSVGWSARLSCGRLRDLFPLVPAACGGGCLRAAEAGMLQLSAATREGRRWSFLLVALEIVGMPPYLCLMLGMMLMNSSVG